MSKILPWHNLIYNYWKAVGCALKLLNAGCTSRWFNLCGIINTSIFCYILDWWAINFLWYTCTFSYKGPLQWKGCISKAVRNILAMIENLYCTCMNILCWCIKHPLVYSLRLLSTLCEKVYIAIDLESQLSKLVVITYNLFPKLYAALTCRYIKNLMGLSGLSVREDAVGNIFGRWWVTNSFWSYVILKTTFARTIFPLWKWWIFFSFFLYTWW